ncbi:MAG TPA: family 20 glycosylhydrolase [Armatimonadetes bacterium]|nr:family 20 glycosylhydrolase [Armatimonadota bacterium]
MVAFRSSLTGARFARASVLLLGLLAVSALILGAAPLAAAPAAVVGDLRATLTPFDGVTPGAGLRVTYRGLPLITRSSINVVSPDWKKTHLTLGRSRAKVVASDLPGGKRLALSAANQAFELEYAIDILEGNRLILDLRGVLHADEPAIIEYSAGYLSAVLLAGQPYRAVVAEGERSGLLPYTGSGTDPRSALVLSPFRRLRVDSRVGTITVEEERAHQGLDLFDARKVPSPWLQASPTLWLGYLEVPLEKGKPFHSRVTLTIDPVEMAERPDRSSPSVKHLPVRDVPDARLSSDPDGRLIPTPRQVRPGVGSFALDEQTRIVVGEDAASRRAARELQERVRERFGLRLRTTPAPLWREESNVIVIGTRSTPAVRKWLARADLAEVTERDGYALRVTPRYVVIAGADAPGTLYGVFTLLQQIQPDAAPPARIAATTIRDWPALATRGVHLLTDHWSTFLHRDLIRDILAPHKVNTILLECEYVKWESHPEIHASWGMPKEEVRALLALARDYYIEVIPLVQTLGHANWIFHNNQHLDLAEDPKAKYAYCPSNPKTYELVFDIFEEALELFGNPRYFHIGHDEFHHRGEFAQHEPCRSKGVDQLFIEDTRRLHDFLAERGARTLMWGDMLLGPGEARDAANAKSVAEARRRREQLPKEILITDWHYAVADDYPSIRILREAGFEVWAATWYEPENVRGFARAAAAHGSGLIQTTWTGYYGNMTALRREFPQFRAYLLAAGYAWNPESPALAEATDAAAQRFLASWPAFSRAPGKEPGFVVDLAPLGSMPWCDTPSRDGWLGYGPEHDLSALEGGVRRLGRSLFHLPGNSQAIALHGPLLPMRYPKSVTVPLGRRASELLFLMATGWEVAEGNPVGKIIVRYADGTQMPSTLLYGAHLRAAHDPRTAVYAPVAWQGRTTGGEPLYLRVYTLRNPFPEREITGVTLVADDTAAAPLLFGLSGVAPKP